MSHHNGREDRTDSDFMLEERVVSTINNRGVLTIMVLAQMGLSSAM